MSAGLLSSIGGSAAGGAATGAATGAAGTAAGAGAAGAASGLSTGAATGAGTGASNAAGALAGGGGGGKGGWLGTGLFGNDKYNPNPSSYAPETGSGQAQQAMPKPQTTTPIALQLMQQLPITDPSFWRV